VRDGDLGAAFDGLETTVTSMPVSGSAAPLAIAEQLVVLDLGDSKCTSPPGLSACACTPAAPSSASASNFGVNHCSSSEGSVNAGTPARAETWTENVFSVLSAHHCPPFVSFFEYRGCAASTTRVRQAVTAAVPTRTASADGCEVLLEERSAVLLVGKVHVDLDRGAGDLLPVEGGPGRAARFASPAIARPTVTSTFQRVLLAEHVDAGAGRTTRPCRETRKLRPAAS